MWILTNQKECIKKYMLEVVLLTFLIFLILSAYNMIQFNLKLT